MEACLSGNNLASNWAAPKPSGATRFALRSVLFATVGAIAAGCGGGGDSCQDQITIGASQSCSGGADAVTVDTLFFT